MQEAEDLKCFLPMQLCCWQRTDPQGSSHLSTLYLFLVFLASLPSHGQCKWKWKQVTSLSDTSEHLKPVTVAIFHSNLTFWVVHLVYGNTTFPGIHYDFKILQSDGLWTVSKVLPKSKKLMARGTWNSPHFQWSVKSVKICSAQEYLGWNPTCSSHNP